MEHFFKGKYNNAKCNSSEITWTNTVFVKNIATCAALKPSRETSLLLLQSSQKAKLIKLLNNNFSWKDNKGVELDNYLLTRESGEA